VAIDCLYCAVVAGISGYFLTLHRRQINTNAPN
jgi:hypothetical protein